MQAAVANRPIQLHLAMFTPHEIEAVEQEAERREHKREQRRAAYELSRSPRDRQRADLIDSLNLQLLDAPLVNTGRPNELDCSVDPLSGADEIVLELEPPGQQGEWSDQAIYELHEAALHYTLRTLQARGNGAEKREALKWIFAPLRYLATLEISGRPQEVLLPPELTPFSFEMCSRICGMRPAALRDQLEPILRQLGLGELFNEITHATTSDDRIGLSAGATDAEEVQDS